MKLGLNTQQIPHKTYVYPVLYRSSVMNDLECVLLDLSLVVILVGSVVVVKLLQQRLVRPARETEIHHAPSNKHKQISLN